jgi:hypothetical protein
MPPRTPQSGPLGRVRGQPPDRRIRVRIQHRAPLVGGSTSRTEPPAAEKSRLKGVRPGSGLLPVNASTLCSGHSGSQMYSMTPLGLPAAPLPRRGMYNPTNRLHVPETGGSESDAIT